MYLPKTEKILSILEPVNSIGEITNLSNLKEVFQQNKPKYTVLPKDFFDSALKEAFNFKNLASGDWVLLGIWKGGGALFFKSLMNELKINQNLYLYDTFGKIPTKLVNKDKDLEFVKSFSLESETSTYLIEVQNLFEDFNLRKNVYFVESDVNDLKKQDLPERISFLFIDVDFYEPVFKSLELFYDKLIFGGILIIDDYYTDFLNCKEAVDTFFNERGIDLKLISSRFSSYAIKIEKK